MSIQTALEPHGSSERYLQRAIIAITQYIETHQKIDLPLLVAMIHLAYAEDYRPDRSAAEVHVRAMLNFIDKLGGFHALPAYLRGWTIGALEGLTGEGFCPTVSYALKDAQGLAELRRNRPAAVPPVLVKAPTASRPLMKLACQFLS